MAARQAVLPVSSFGSAANDSNVGNDSNGGSDSNGSDCGYGNVGGSGGNGSDGLTIMAARTCQDRGNNGQQ